MIPILAITDNPATGELPVKIKTVNLFLNQKQLEKTYHMPKLN
jgi:hypothetical protein